MIDFAAAASLSESATILGTGTTEGTGKPMGSLNSMIACRSSGLEKRFKRPSDARPTKDLTSDVSAWKAALR
jgi:hypothetical protein